MPDHQYWLLFGIQLLANALGDFRHGDSAFANSGRIKAGWPFRSSTDTFLPLAVNYNSYVYISFSFSYIASAICMNDRRALPSSQ